jgi:hypothetical protein
LNNAPVPEQSNALLHRVAKWQSEFLPALVTGWHLAFGCCNLELWATALTRPCLDFAVAARAELRVKQKVAKERRQNARRAQETKFHGIQCKTLTQPFGQSFTIYCPSQNK